MSNLEKILEGSKPDFTYYTSKGGSSTSTDFGQKSIPYGMDRPAMGNSGQPYMKTGVTATREQLFDASPEGLLEIRTTNEYVGRLTHGITDMMRIGKYFTQPVLNGLLFTTKQTLLSQQQEIQRRKSLGGKPKNKISLGKSALASLLNTTQILPQTEGVGIGLHLNNPIATLGRVYEESKTGDTTLHSKSPFGYDRTTAYGVGDPGKRGLDRTNFGDYKDSNGGEITIDGENTGGGEGETLDISDIAQNAPTVDKITYKSLYTTDEGTVSNALATSDMIPFYITVLSNDDPSKNVHIHFRAFIDNFSDNFSANWQPHKFMGRGEDFYTYGGYSRDINLTFKVHAQSKQEQKPMYEKLNYLASVMAPDYNPTSGHMRGNIIRLTVGDYIVNTAGVLTGFAMSIPSTYPWDIGRDNDGKKKGDALPTIIDVSTFTFKPIEEFIPSINYGWDGTSEDKRFINNGTLKSEDGLIKQIPCFRF